MQPNPPHAPERIEPHGAIAAGRSGSAWTRFLLIFALLLAADLALKSWGVDHLSAGGTRRLVPKLLALRWTENHGAIFGMLQGARLFFIIASVAAAALILYYFCHSRAREWGVQFGLSLILAGAMGNLYDRAMFGYVRDMLYLFPDVNLPFGWSWGGGRNELYPWIFNLADVYLLMGIAILLIRTLFTKQPVNPSDAP